LSDGNYVSYGDKNVTLKVGHIKLLTISATLSGTNS